MMNTPNNDVEERKEQSNSPPVSRKIPTKNKKKLLIKMPIVVGGSGDACSSAPPLISTPGSAAANSPRVQVTVDMDEENAGGGDSAKNRAGSFKRWFRRRHRSGESQGPQLPLPSSPSDKRLHHHSGAPAPMATSAVAAIAKNPAIDAAAIAAGIAPQTPTLKMRYFIDSLRPRSRSDAAKEMANAKRARDAQRTQPLQNAKLTLDSNGGNNGGKSGGESGGEERGSGGTNSPLSISPGATSYLATKEPHSLLRLPHALQYTGSFRGSREKHQSLRSPSALGPEQYIEEMFRQRASSDPRPKARAAALAAHNRVKQKLAGTIPGSPGGNEVYNRFETQHLLIWRDKKTGTKIIRLPSEDDELRMAVDDLDDSENLVFAKFARAYKCHDLVPIMSKLVVFDTKLNVRKAFFALVDNGVKAAPLWDSSSRRYTGMLTITDFIEILRKHYKSLSETWERLEKQNISNWKEILSEDDIRTVVTIDATDSVFDAVLTLCRQKVHRLLVVDRTTSNALYVMTYKRVLSFICHYLHDLHHPLFVTKSIRELEVGTYEDIATVTLQTRLIDALNLFLDRRISALPVVDSTGKIVDIFCKFDVTSWAAQNSYGNLDIPIEEALKFKPKDAESLRKCFKTDSLLLVMEGITRADVHRLIIVDSEDRVEGVVALSDILSHLILKPAALLIARRKSSISVPAKLNHQGKSKDNASSSSSISEQQESTDVTSSDLPTNSSHSESTDNSSSDTTVDSKHLNNGTTVESSVVQEEASLHQPQTDGECTVVKTKENSCEMLEGKNEEEKWEKKLEGVSKVKEHSFKHYHLDTAETTMHHHVDNSLDARATNLVKNGKR